MLLENPITYAIAIPVTSNNSDKGNIKITRTQKVIIFAITTCLLFSLAELFGINGVAFAYIIGFSSNTVYLVIKYFQIRNKNH